MNGLVIALIMLVASAALIAINLPAILRAMGLHRHYTIPAFHLPGKRVLVVCTSHATLDPTGRPTGAFGSEFTVPYYAFIDAGMTVDMASIKGGAIPLQPPSWNWPLACAAKADRWQAAGQGTAGHRGHQ